MLAVQNYKNYAAASTSEQIADEFFQLFLILSLGYYKRMPEHINKNLTKSTHGNYR